MSKFRTRSLMIVAFASLAAGCGSSTGTPDGAFDWIDSSTATADEVRQWVEAYKAAHPGNGGKDWDINAKTGAQLQSDADARRLVGVCGRDQRPMFPLLAWEYGGGDHPWINPMASALAYCVYVPAAPSTEHWSYTPSTDHVVADMYVKFPAENPCAAEVEANQVANCIGNASNFEILVDGCNRNDGADAGLALSEASTEMKLILADGAKVHLIDNL